MHCWGLAKGFEMQNSHIDKVSSVLTKILAAGVENLADKSALERLYEIYC